MHSYRPRLRFAAGLCALALLAGGAVPARAFLWESSARRWIREADRLIEEGRRAEQEQRVMDASAAYSQAHALYTRARTEKPGLMTEHVAARDAECRARLRTLFARAAAGQVPIPDPNDRVPVREPFPAVAGAPEDGVPPPEKAEAGEPPPQPVRPARRSWLGRIFRGADAAPSTEGDPAAAAPAEVQLDAPRVAPVPAPARREAPALIKPTLPAAAAPPRAAPVATPPTDAALSRRVQAMLDDGAGAEAVLFLEGVLEKAGDQATLAQQVLFAQALLHRRNYARAERVLTPLLRSHADDPSVLMLAAGLRLAQGQPIVALRHLDRLVEKYPRYADAYINLAYTRFAMDPEANRDEAVKYYRHALILGAERDPRLEMELRVVVEP